MVAQMTVAGTFLHRLLPPPREEELKHPQVLVLLPVTPGPFAVFQPGLCCSYADHSAPFLPSDENEP